MDPHDAPRNEGLARDPAEWSELMGRAQNGDGAAYRRLLLGITPYLRAIASRAHSNSSDAEDTVQDILMTLHSIRYTYDRDRPFKPWLAGIAQHRVPDRLRARGRLATRELPLGPEHETFASPEENPDEAASEGRALREAMQEIPEGQRRALTMLKLNEMSLHEAAAASGMSVASLKVATHRGIKALRAIMLRGGKRG